MLRVTRLDATTVILNQAKMHLLSSCSGLVVYVIPYHSVIVASCVRPANSKDEPSIECLS